MNSIESSAISYMRSGRYALDFPGIDISHPWTGKSLNAAEGEFVDSYRNYGDVPGEIEMNLMYLIGSGLVSEKSGRWTLVSPELLGLQDGQYGICVEMPDESMYVMNSLASNALRFKTGEYWFSLFLTANPD